VSSAIASLSGISTVNSITVTSASITSDQLDALLGFIVTVSGDVQISGVSVESVNMPLLQTVGGDLQLISNTAVTTVNFANLTSINGSLIINNNGALLGTAVSDGFAQLQTVVGAVQLYTFSISGGLPARTTLALPTLTSIGSLDVRNTYVSTVSMAALQTIGGSGQQGLFSFRQMLFLRSLDFPSLASVSGRMSFGPTIPMLSNLCQVGLPSSGYASSSAVRLAQPHNSLCRP
jgi:hypothetical protein